MDSYKDGRNVAAQKGDAKRTLNFYRALLRLKKGHEDLFVEGSFEDNDKTIVVTKTAPAGARAALVVLTFSPDKQAFEVPATLADGEGKLLFSTVAHDDVPELEAYEARVYLY
ncbi:hypothetical protein JCM1841_006536 [Sporobolomyces salmonicolor]